MLKWIIEHLLYYQKWGACPVYKQLLNISVNRKGINAAINHNSFLVYLYFTIC